MSQAGLFERFVRIETEVQDVEVLPALEKMPAFVVQANLLPSAQDSRLRDRFMEYPKKVKRGQARQRELNEKKYWPVWMERVVVGWRGLTKGNLERLVVGSKIIDEEGFLEAYPTGEVPYLHETALELWEASHDTFSSVVYLELNEIRQEHAEEEEDEREDALGNLGNGSVSNSALGNGSTSPDGVPASTQTETVEKSVTPSVATGS